MRDFQYLGLVLSLFLGAIAALGQKANQKGEAPADAQPLPAARSLERPTDADILILRTGEKLLGSVLNETFGLRTFYGELKFERRIIAAIDLEFAENQIVSLFTVNSNRFSGFLNEASFVIQLQNGTKTEVRREKVLKASLRRREAESTGTPRNQMVRLKNGDYFHGKILNGSLVVASNNARVTVRSSETEAMAFIDGPTPVVKVHLSNGDLLQGILETEDLDVQLDLGFPIHLYRNWIETVSSRDEFPVSETVKPEGRQTEQPFSSSSRLMPGKNSEGLVWIPPGKFVMGSPTEEADRGLDEGPPAEVTIPHGFWMGKCEVTQGEYLALMGNNPSRFAGDLTCPVEKVSWQDSLDYCAKLTEKQQKAGTLPDGYAYRLPTETEWEYACRAGTATRFSYGEDPGYSKLGVYAWFTGNSQSTTHSVGTKQPNAWGLYDMHGNVWEWCLDHWSGSASKDDLNSLRRRESSLRGARGGSWLYDARFCRSANRDDYFPSNRCSDLGFRVVLAPLQP